MASKGKKTQTTRKTSSRTSTRKVAAKKGKSTTNAKTTTVMSISRDERHKMIAEAAYRLAEERKFRDADPIGDWLSAEHEVDQKLASGASV